MHNYLTLVKLLLKYMFRRDKTKKSQKWMAVIYALLGFTYLMLAAFVVVSIYLYSTVFAQNGLQNEFITMLLVAGVVFVLIFGIIAMLSNLYFSRDTEFFVSLPVKPAAIYMAKLTVIYLTELLTSVLIFAPCLVTAGITLQLSWVYYVTMFFAVLLTPALPLFLASILSIPIMYVVSFFRNRGAMGSIAVILLFGVLFAAYYFVIIRFSDIGSADDIVITAGIVSLVQAISNIFYPLYALVKFATMTPAFGLSTAPSMLLHLLLFVGTVGVLGALSVLISNAVYKKGAVSQLEGARRNRNTSVKYSASGAFSALLKKEWRELIRTPAFAFQCLSGVVLCPIVIVFMTFLNKGTNIEGAAMVDFQTMMWYVTVGFIGFFGVGMNVGASTAFTREGDKFYYCKLIPVDYRVQLRAKTLLYTLISSVTILISLVVVSVFDFHIGRLLLAMGYLLIYNYGYVHFAVLFDLSKPKLDWVTPNEATKNSRNATIPMLINMAVSLALMILPIFLSILVPGIIGSVIGWVFLYLAAIALAVIFPIALRKNSKRLFARLG